MSAADRVRRAQRTLQAIVVSGAVLWSSAALFAVLVAGMVLAALLPGAPRLAGAVAVLAAFAAAATFGVLAWRGRLVWSFDRVALWIEERAPELRYALVTAIDPRHAPITGPLVDRLIGRVEIGSFLRRAALRAALPALVALVVAGAAFVMLPERWRAPVAARDLFGGAPMLPPTIGNRLAPLTVRITPPAYADMPARTFADPSTITGLYGSRVTVSGRGAGDGIGAALTPAGRAARPIAVSSDGDRWSLTFIITDSAGALLKLTDREHERLIVVDPQVDGSPAVRLRAPIRDSTLRVVGGTLELAADISDDIGLAAARFEYIVSSGAAETFTFRQGTLGERSFGGARRGRIAVNVALSSFRLGEGDRLSIRAVARDNNTVSGPGTGYSETRTIRVARRDEYAAVAVSPALLAVDTSAISLRALIIATEELNRRRSRTAREGFVAEARELALHGGQIRRAIQSIIDLRAGGEHEEEETAEADHDHGPAEQIAANPLLVTALNAMWDATGKLEIAQTAEALPPMYVAYRALQSLRTERRYYTRAAARPTVVNIERVRLTGSEQGVAAPRAPRPGERSDRELWRRDYAAAVRLLRTAPDSAAALFTAIRVEALRGYPALSAALAEVAAAIESGRDVARPLVRARRLLEGSAVRLDSLPVWTGIW